VATRRRAAPWVRRGADGTGEVLRAGTLAGGDGALLPHGAVVTLRNLGGVPAVVLVLAITPAK
jgi:hypothetical protein